jgi:hypothetical protein
MADRRRTDLSSRSPRRGEGGKLKVEVRAMKTDLYLNRELTVYSDRVLFGSWKKGSKFVILGDDGAFVLLHSPENEGWMAPVRFLVEYFSPGAACGSVLN